MASADVDAQFSRFLSCSIRTLQPNQTMCDSVYTVGDIHEGGDVAECFAGDERLYLWVADYRVLSVKTHGDSADATAAITIAAREVQDPTEESSTATPLIEEDTAKWSMIKAPITGGKWMVCGPGVVRGELFEPGPGMRTINWPHGGSRESVKLAIDSIRRARTLPHARSCRPARAALPASAGKTAVLEVSGTRSASTLC